MPDFRGVRPSEPYMWQTPITSASKDTQGKTLDSRYIHDLAEQELTALVVLPPWGLRSQLSNSITENVKKEGFGILPNPSVVTLGHRSPIIRRHVGE